MSFQFMGIDHVQLVAPEHCETTARRFYGGLLGWMEVSKPEPLAKRGGVWFQCGTHQVHIGVQPTFTPAAKAHPAFEVQHLKSLRQHLLNHNLNVMDDETRLDEGVSRFYIHDPFGNRLEFLEKENSY